MKKSGQKSYFRNTHIHGVCDKEKDYSDLRNGGVQM